MNIFNGIVLIKMTNLTKSEIFCRKQTVRLGTAKLVLLVIHYNKNLEELHVCELTVLRWSITVVIYRN